MSPSANESLISDERIWREKAARYNPIRNLTPTMMIERIENFKAGWLTAFARLFDAIQDRDDFTRSCSIKRKGKLGSLPWEIVKFPEANESDASLQQEALTYFYRNLECTDVLDQDLRGGFATLVEQMADSIGAKYSIHEVLWDQRAKGITAKFQRVPTWFFENRTGKLRYLPQEGSLDGNPLDPGAWMVTVGDGIGIANALCYMFKTLPLRDWLIYCERHGMPVVQGKTNAKKGTTEWNNMKEVVRGLATDTSVVTNIDEVIEIISTTAQGQLPQPILVERMDRGISILWRGADLSTMSANQGQGQGASLQGEEADFLTARDATNITETLRRYIDRMIIRYTFGENTEPAAGILVQLPPKKDVAQELAIDNFFKSAGIEQSKNDLRERYQRAEPQAGEGDEDIIGAQPEEQAAAEAAAMARGQGQDERAFANERLTKASVALLARNTGKEIKPIQNRMIAPLVEDIRNVLALQDPESVRIGLRRIRSSLATHLQAMNSSAETSQVSTILKNAFSAAEMNGFASGKIRRVATATATAVNEKQIQSATTPIEVRVARAPKEKKTNFTVSRDEDGNITNIQKSESTT